MFIHNYHTHTKRCGHAVGEDEQYVHSALKNGFQTLGFSDHIFHNDYEKNENYLKDIQVLKEKYQDQIQIYKAFECEYFDFMIPYYQQLIANNKVDYLIFGNHCTYIGEKFYNFCCPFDDIHYLEIYYDTLKKALDSKLFKYICHPDVFLKGYKKWDEHTIALTHRIGKLLMAYPCYVELSGSGFRSHAHFEYNGKIVPPYPFKEFFKILSQYPLQFVLGADAHAPEQLNDNAIDFIKNMAAELNLNIIEKLDL